MGRMFRSMRSRMFISFSAVLLTVILAFLAFNAAQTYQTLRKDLSVSMQQIALAVARELDDEMRQLSLMTERIVFSTQLREAILNQLPGSEGAERYRLLNRLNDLMYSICGPKLTFYHANIITDTGYQYAFGQTYGYGKLSEKPQNDDWYIRTVEKGGKVLITPLHRRAVGGADMDVISVCRGFGLVYGLPAHAVVEMQRDYGFLDELIQKAAFLTSSEQKTAKVLVFDQSGARIYPKDISQAEIDHYAANFDLSEQSAYNPLSRQDELFFGAQGEFSGWRVIVVPRREVLTRLVRALASQTLIVSVLLVAAAAIVSFLLSRKFATPLQRLCAYVDNLRLDQLGEASGWQTDSDVDELDQLSRAFSQMTKRLGRSLDQVVELKNAEMHARMLALQAQMNPHFLYNTLAVINIMVENGEVQQVQQACKNLSNTLEYISTQELAPVMLQQELQHALNYMDLILMRYPDDIEFTVDVPEDILQVRVPKLVIQPLVENAVKYATQKDPVWHVRLSVSVEGERWYVQVQDDGDGFDLQTLRQLREKMSLLRSGGEIPQLTLHGMGIMNIFLRLRSAYGDEAVFWIDNRPGEGASITIGGTL